MTVTVSDLRNLVTDLDNLEDKVDRIAGAPIGDERVNLFFTGVSMGWAAAETGSKEATWRNTGGDFNVTRISYGAWFSYGSWNLGPPLFLTHDAGAVKLFDTGAGLGCVVPGVFYLGAGPIAGFDQGIRSRMFDFEWNVRRHSNMSWYGTAATGPGMLTRRALGNQERGECLEFIRPWTVPMGDGLTFRARPTARQWNADGASSPGGARYTVHFSLHGYRTGAPR